MSALLSDYTGNTVLIYNKEGIHLASTVIDEHDKVAKQIHISDFPDGLNVNDECKILILSSPRPCEFNGKIRKIGKDPYIGLFQGQLKENDYLLILGKGHEDYQIIGKEKYPFDEFEIVNDYISSKKS